MSDTRMLNPEEPKPLDPEEVRRNLLRVAHMFGGYRNDKLMRRLARLAIKCAREGLIRV